jgi:hypothetical protein
VNFKFGLEKHVFAFTDADFVLFSPNEDQWHMRLEARPVRTDTNISDTGTVKAELNFQRAEMLRDTAVNGKIAWQRGQLGMITKLIDGRDSGWRGMLELQSEVSGTPSDLHFTAAATLHDFRRFDIYAGDALSVNATCSGIASVPANAVSGFECQLPVSPGTLNVSGSVGAQLKSYDLSIAGENVGSNSLISFLRHVKKDIPVDLTSTGSLNIAAKFRKVSAEDPVRVWTGRGTTTDITLKSGVMKEPVTIKPLSIDLTTPGGTPPLAIGKGKAKKVEVVGIPGQFLTVSPFSIALGGKLPTLIDARLSTEGYQLGISGPAELEHVIGVARGFGVSVPKVRLRGDLQMNVAISGAWRGLGKPAVNGSAKIVNGHAEVPGIAKEILLVQSDIVLVGNEFQLRSMQAQVGDLKFTGSATVPRHCDPDGPCGPGLDLQFDTLDAGQVNELLNPTLKKQPWYKLFGSSAEESLLTKIYAVGRVSAKQITFDKLVGTKFYADFRLNHGDLLVSNVRAAVLGGTHEGQWRADFTGSTPVYTGSGTATRLNAAQFASLGRAAIGTGNVSGRYELKMSGWNAGELAKSAEGSATFDWSGATIRAFAASGRGPAKVNDFNGKLVLKDGVLAFNESKMTAGNGIYFVTGTAEPEKLALEFKSDTAAGYRITGSLRAPAVAVTDDRADETKPKTEAVSRK